MSFTLPQSFLTLSPPPGLPGGVAPGAAVTSPDAGEGAAVFTLTAVSLGQPDTGLPTAPVSMAPVVVDEKPPVSAAELLAALDRSARTIITPTPVPASAPLPTAAPTPVSKDLPVVATPPVLATPPVAETPPVVQERPIVDPRPPVRQQPPAEPAPPRVETLPAVVPPPVNSAEHPAAPNPVVIDEHPSEVMPPAIETPEPPLKTPVDAKPPVAPVAVDPEAGPVQAESAPSPVEEKLPAGSKKPQADDGSADDLSADTGDTVALQPASPVQPTPPINPLAALCAAAPVVVQTIVAEAPVAAEIKAPKTPATQAVSSVAKAPAAPLAAPAAPPIAEMPVEVETPVRPKAPAQVEVPAQTTTSTQTRKDASVEVSVTMLSDKATNETVPTFTLPTATAAAHPLTAASPVQQPVAAADVMINRHLDLARGDAWLDTLAQDIAAIAGTGDRLKFALQPEHLGKLDVEVSRHDNGVAVHMTTRNEEARAIISAAQPRLLDELRANGTRVVEADVTSQMNAQTNSNSGGTARQNFTGFIETAADVHAPVAASATKTNTNAADGRYA